MFYGEVEFTYKGIVYALCGIANEGIEYASCPEDVKYFETIEEFETNATTFDGKLVKNVWDEVENANWLQ